MTVTLLSGAPREDSTRYTKILPQNYKHIKFMNCFLQVEYAMEAVKLGSATVGLKSKTHAVILALKRASSELSAHQKKIIPIDNHIGMTIAGLTADARVLR